MPATALFEVVTESAAAARCALEEEYGARLVIADGRVAVNFVSTIDGVVSFGRAADDSRAVGGGVLADRTVMAMLRAVAGAIVVGAGTLRATLNHQWTPRALLPDRAQDLAELRAVAGLPAADAPLLVVGGGGDIPLDAVAVARPEVPVHVLTADGVVTPADASAAARTDTGTTEPFPAGAVVAAARRLAAGGPVLCEGGPHLFGTILDGEVPVELFLTVAPQLAGRAVTAPERRSLVEGVALPPFRRAAHVLSVRRAGDHLLLRYAVDAPG